MVIGGWRASKEVLAMMWEDEAARAAEGNAAVPGAWRAQKRKGGGGDGGGDCVGGEMLLLVLSTCSFLSLLRLAVVRFVSLLLAFSLVRSR